MAKKDTLARFKLNLKSMIDEIDNDFSNISLLRCRCAERCKDIMESSEKIMNELEIRS